VNDEELESKKADINVEISFMLGLLKRDPDYVQALKILGDAYASLGDYNSVLMVDLKLSGLTPEDTVVWYNLACSFSMLEDYERCAIALEKSIDLGYENFHWLSRDPMLKPFRKSSYYTYLRKKIKTLKGLKALKPG
jgi:hypothetical protein